MEGHSLKVTDMVGGRWFELLQTDCVGEGVEGGEDMTKPVWGNFRGHLHCMLR